MLNLLVFFPGQPRICLLFNLSFYLYSVIFFLLFYLQFTDSSLPSLFCWWVHLVSFSFQWLYFSALKISLLKKKIQCLFGSFILFCWNFLFSIYVRSSSSLLEHFFNSCFKALLIIPDICIISALESFSMKLRFPFYPLKFLVCILDI